MFIEAIGLPGSGKTSIQTACMPLLKKAGINIQLFGRVARNQAEKMGQKTRYLKRHSGRNWLYGSLAFAHQHPEIYDLLFQGSRKSFPENLWAMDFIAQLYFAKEADTSDMLVFIDEGFVHRGAAAYFLDSSDANLQRYLKRVPPCDVLVHFECSVQTAFDRCSERGRTPKLYQGDTDANTKENYRHLQKLHNICVRQQAKSGVQIISVDTEMPMKEAAECLAYDLEELFQNNS